MQQRLLDWLACPRCGAPDLDLEVTRTSSSDTVHAAWRSDELKTAGLDFEGRSVVEIVEGTLGCPSCEASYPILEGIPRLLPDGDVQGPASGHRWTQFDGAAPEYESNFSDMTHPLGPADYLGKCVLDAGCGFGRHAFYAARYGAEVIAMDSSADAVASSARNCKGLHRVHVIQGDLYAPPLKPAVFDTVLCFGVLHHVEDPREGFRTLGNLVAPGGHLQVWVYGPRHGSIKMISAGLHGAASAMGDEQLHDFAKGLARSIRVFSHTPYRLLRGVPVLGHVVTHLPAHDHHKWPFDVLVADIYDRLRVPVTAYITGEDLEWWFGEGGYADIQVTRRVRNNESFRGTGTRR